MKLYNTLYQVTVSSTNHGERTFIVTALTPLDALVELELLIEPWRNDEDMELTINKGTADTFVVITDRAHEGAKP